MFKCLCILIKNFNKIDINTFVDNKLLMASILADRQYTLDFCNLLEKNSLIQELDQIVILKINKIASRVGAPSYQKTPIFKRHTMYNKKNKKGKGDNKDWETLRNFKTTELEKNIDGIESKVDDIRSNLNKLTDKTYETVLENIVDIINEIILESQDEHLEKIGTSIFDIGCLNKFWAKLYVKIYKSLIEKFTIMEDICLNNFKKFSTVFDTIEYVDSNDDYIQFCDCNKVNEKRRALSSFFIYCVEESIIDKKNMEEIIVNLLQKIDEYIDEIEKRKEIEEIVENLSIILIKGKKSVFEMEKFNFIKEQIEKFSKIKNKNGLSKKVLFKFMDIMDELDE